MSELERRTLDEAHYIIATQKTVRESAKHFNISKSTLHSDIKNRLPKLNYKLFLKVQKIFQKHFDEKHIRGGNATKSKYQNISSS